MLEPSKSKNVRKHKEKVAISEGIPEAPKISDFDIVIPKSLTNDEDVHPQAPDAEVSCDTQMLQNEENTSEKEEEDSRLHISQLPSGSEEMCEKLENEIPKNNSTLATISGVSLTEAQAAGESTFNSAWNNNVYETYSSSTCNYSKLSEALKTCTLELQNASAPFDDKECSKIHHVNLNLSNLNKESIDIHNYSFTLTLRDLVIPFADEKLSEFYLNPELNEIKSTVRERINEEISSLNMRDNYFYNLLIEYIESRISISKNEAKIKELKKRINICISSMWTIWNDVKIKDKEVCADGNSVVFVKNYTKAQFNTNIYDEFIYLLKEIKKVTFDTFIQDYFICSFLKLKVEHYLYCLLTSCSEFTNLKADSLVTVSTAILNTYSQKCVHDLKEAISVLFFFQRKQVLDVDVGYFEESKVWITDLVSVLLRIGNWKDHIFILNHILRCPGGISTWAACFIQLPCLTTFIDPFKNDQINHIMAVLHIFLSLLDQKEDVNISNHDADAITDSNPWTVVDSDGEIEGETNQKYCLLKENDLVSILNQIPFGYLFKSIFYFNEEGITPQLITYEYLLNLFSFSTDFIKILLSGLKLYGARRYKQFTKRLGQLITHMVHYTTEAMAIFKLKDVSRNQMIRIQTEYDNFFLRSTKFIYSAKRHGPWQFLAGMPYHMASPNTILKLYGILQLKDNQNENVVNINFSSFEEMFSKLPGEEQYYLLTTFANMALARDISEIDFIKNVLLQLFFIGFVSTQTMDYSNKNVKYLLCSICSLHPFLISEILHVQNCVFLSDSSYDERVSVQLWLKLPLETWRPTKADLEILTQWLTEPVQSLRCELARIILQSFNYVISQEDLLLSRETQQAIALMLMRANVKLCNEVEQGFIKNVSNLVRPQNVEQSFNDWVWTILLKLRLHMLDKTEASLHNCFSKLDESLRNIPDIDTNIELYHLVLKKHPMACFIALMTTTLGHSVPIMFDKGFELVEILFHDGKYDAGIACLEFMTFLFLDCCDSLYKCEKFISLLSQLIVADNTYVQMAKNLISNNFPGPVLKSVECMIQNQLNCCRGLGFSKFSDCIKLWLISLTKLPLWIQEPGVLYMLDKLLKNAFFDFASSRHVTEIIESLLEETKSSSESKSPFSSLVGWMNLKLNIPSLLPKGFNGDAPWLSYLIIQTEFENYERKHSIWLELLKELHGASDKKTDVDNSLKKVCNSLGLPVRQSNCLAIYKWSYQLLNTDVSHPLIPLMWQKFFYLYFFRVPGLSDRGSIGDKFFDGVLNQRTFKQLAQRLSETREYFKDLSGQIEEDNGHARKCLSLYETFSLWMDDAKLLEPHLSVHSLPVEYNPELLGLLIHGSDTPWIDFVEYQSIEQSFKNPCLKWSEIKNRSRRDKPNRSASIKADKPQTERLKERFNSYEIPLAPPSVVDVNKYALSKISPSGLTNFNEMQGYVNPLVEKLLEFKEQYRVRMNENILLGCHLQELSSQLYTKTETQTILEEHCSGTSKTVGGKTVHYDCAGPAVINLKYEEFKPNEDAQKRFNHCEKAFDENVQRNISHLPPYLSTSAVAIDIAIQDLKREYQLAKRLPDGDEPVKKFKETGVNLFYSFVQILSQKVVGTPPLEHVFDRYVEVLGKTFVENNPEENDRLLDCISSNEFCGEKLIKYLTPNVSSSPQDFVKNYFSAVNCSSGKSFSVLSKFDVVQFLRENEPKLSVRSSLISAVGRGIVSHSRKPNENENVLQILNEHLGSLLRYDFPEHYGEILNFLLEASENQSIGPGVWYTFLTCLFADKTSVFPENGRIGQNTSENGHSIKKVKHYFVRFASEQAMPLEVIKGTMSILAAHFTKERLKAGTYGLYQKYNDFLEPLFTFFGMLSYSCITKTLEQDTGSLSEKITHQLWPLLIDLYAPWMVPYRNENPLKKDGCCNDMSISLPWSLNHLSQACFCVSVFTESVRFLLDTLPGFNNVLNYLWYFYGTHFGQPYVKDCVLNVIHDGLASLPWETFCPSLQEVELMLHIVSQFLPSCHTFLGVVFINVKWQELLQHYFSLYDTETVTKLHVCLLHLLVKLPMEPSLKQNDRVICLLNEANEFAWHLIDSSNYEVVLNWFTTSCDPRIILMDERLEYYKLDSAIFRLLQTCAGYTTSVKLFHPTTLTKRALFVRACTKWLMASNRRFKCKDSPLFTEAVCTILNTMDSMMMAESTPTAKKIDEAVVLFGEILAILVENGLSSLVEGILCGWLQKPRSHVCVYGLMRSAGVSIDNACVYGRIMEATLENYFDFIDNTSWSEVITTHAPFSKSNGPLEKVLIDNKCFLTLHATLLKTVNRNEECLNSKLVLTDVLHLLTDVKFGTSAEPKLLLLITFCLKLIEFEINAVGKDGILLLIRFSTIINGFLEIKETGFLSAVGLARPNFTNRFKLICVGICSGIVIFLRKKHPEYQGINEDEILRTLGSIETNKIYQSISQYALYAKTIVTEISTIGDIIKFVQDLGVKLFNTHYLNKMIHLEQSQGDIEMDEKPISNIKIFKLFF